MKTTLAALIVTLGLASAAQAAPCPEANYDGCASDGYAIVEVEPDIYWPHNEMASAHRLIPHQVRYKRIRVPRRSLFGCKH